jgi:hypothetical protein
MAKIFYWCPDCQKLYPQLRVKRETDFRNTRRREYFLSGGLELEKIDDTQSKEAYVAYDMMIITCPEENHEIAYIEIGGREIDEEDLENALEDYVIICNPKTGEIVDSGSMVPDLSPEKVKQLLSELF